MKLYYVVLLTGWTTALVTLAVFHVGQMSEPKEYSTSLPFTIFMTVAIPALLGYLIGKESHEH
jgi:hypothetical protein